MPCGYPGTWDFKNEENLFLTNLFCSLLWLYLHLLFQQPSRISPAPASRWNLSLLLQTIEKDKTEKKIYQLNFQENSSTKEKPKYGKLSTRSSQKMKCNLVENIVKTTVKQPCPECSTVKQIHMHKKDFKVCHRVKTEFC